MNTTQTTATAAAELALLCWNLGQLDWNRLQEELAKTKLTQEELNACARRAATKAAELR
jgi:hypothetical protein